MKKWILPIIMALLLIPIVSTMEDCEGVMNIGDMPCSIKSAWEYPDDCNTYTVDIFNEERILLRTATMGDYGSLSKYCNITFGIQTNETEMGSYLLNFSSRDTVIITIQEDNNMLLALVIGVVFIVALFIFLTFAVKEDKPFLANFFFLGIFIFTTILSNLLWKITNINSAPYEPIMLIIYRIFLIITMLMMFIVLILLTIDAVQMRKWKGNPVDNYRDNLGKDEKNQF